MRKLMFLYLVVWFFLLLSPVSYALNGENLDIHHYKVSARQTLEVLAVMEVGGEFFAFPVAIYGNPYHRFTVVSLPDSRSGSLSVLFNGPVNILKADDGISADLIALDNDEYLLTLGIKGSAVRIERGVVVQGESSLLPLKSRLEFSSDPLRAEYIHDDLPDHWLSYIAPDKTSLVPAVENDVAVFMMRSGGGGKGRGESCQCPACEKERRKMVFSRQGVIVKEDIEMSLSPRRRGGFQKQLNIGGAQVGINIADDSPVSVRVSRSSKQIEVSGDMATSEKYGFLVTPEVEIRYRDLVTVRTVESAAGQNNQAPDGREEGEAKETERCNCASCQSKSLNPPPPPPSSGASSVTGY